MGRDKEECHDDEIVEEWRKATRAVVLYNTQ